MEPRPIGEWPVQELQEKHELVQECRETFGKQAARELMAKLGFPIPPPELVDDGWQPAIDPHEAD